MNRYIALVCCAVHLTCFGNVGSSQFGEASALDAAREPVTSCSRCEIKACSDLQFSKEEAVRQAEQRFDMAFAKTVADRTGTRFPQDALFRHRSKLLYGKGAHVSESTENIEKAYGTAYRHVIVVSFTQDTLREWFDELVQGRRSNLKKRVAATILTTIAWLVGLAAIIRLDRWTRGYRRPLIVIVTVAILLCATFVTWTYIHV